MRSKVFVRGEVFSLSYSVLKARQRDIRVAFSEPFGLRVHRAISWLGRAEHERSDDDVQFILMWIAFNAAYARERDDGAQSERDGFRKFFQTLVDLDDDGRIYEIIWRRYSDEIRVFLDNPYVFAPFWHHHNGVDGYENWNESFAASQRRVGHALRERDTLTILKVLFDRLYVLRNQLIHGGSTYQSSINRNQVRDGAAILASLVPIFIDIMMDNHTTDWGPSFYPVVR